MENIINQIIQIDASAQERLAEASAMREEYKRVLTEKIMQTNESLSQQQKDRISRVLELESNAAATEKELITAQNAAAVERLEEAYSKRHIALEEELFKNVIEGFA